ncbi:MAG TPA: hypothetical protein VMU08_03090 [Rhizomicrobium sp.]|nr:hypothetical protein [Rhizomicrobium sp.]
MRRILVALSMLSLSALPAAAAPADCSKGAIPPGPLKGSVNGAAFVLGSVTRDPNTSRDQGGVKFDEYHIYLNGKDGTVFDVTAITPKGKLPDGKTFVSDINGNGPEAGPGSHEIQGWSINNKGRNLEINFFEVNDASLQIAFGKRAGNALPTQIHFCVPSKKTELGGSFTLPLK